MIVSKVDPLCDVLAIVTAFESGAANDAGSDLARAASADLIDGGMERAMAALGSACGLLVAMSNETGVDLAATIRRGIAVSAEGC